MKIYMQTTKDDYELPVLVADNVNELATAAGVAASTILSAISHKYKGWARVEIEEDE